MKAEILIRNEMPAILEASVFSDRVRQFVDRLKWDLCVTPDGYEVDEYDDNDSEYLVVHKKNRHLGSCRVRPVSAGTMLIDHFRPFFPEAAEFLSNQKNRVVELTRFCRAPDLSVDESKQMLSKLADTLDNYRDAKYLTGFMAVVFPQITRFLDSIGVRYLIVSKSRMRHQTVYLICITHAVSVRPPRAGISRKSHLQIDLISAN
jgi:N-acyl-L-homoserine lactone synthetase